MILGFKQHFPWGEKTYFREKILAGVGMDWVTMMHPQKDNTVHTGESFAIKTDFLFYTPKIHTLRADPHDRWKPGRKIEMVYRGAGYKILSHFNKGIAGLEKCISTQKIEIKWTEFEYQGRTMMCPWIKIDGKDMLPFSDEVAANDGFKDMVSFQRWFKKDFTGKIIHWTDFRY